MYQVHAVYYVDEVCGSLLSHPCITPHYACMHVQMTAVLKGLHTTPVLLVLVCLHCSSTHISQILISALIDRTE